MGPNWPLSEFWSDKIKPLRKAMDGFTMPLLLQALKENAAVEKVDLDDVDDSSETLLSHLVKHTQGRNAPFLAFLSVHRYILNLFRC